MRDVTIEATGETFAVEKLTDSEREQVYAELGRKGEGASICECYEEFCIGNIVYRCIDDLDNPGECTLYRTNVQCNDRVKQFDVSAAEPYDAKADDVELETAESTSYCNGKLRHISGDSRSEIVVEATQYVCFRWVFSYNGKVTSTAVARLGKGQRSSARVGGGSNNVGINCSC